MKLFPLVALSTYALAADDLLIGALRIVPIGNHHVARNVMIENDQVFAGDRSSVFTFGQDSPLASFASKKYMGLNDLGELIMSDKPWKEFSVASDSTGTKAVTYDGNEVFQVCGDNSIAHKSKCVGGRNVMLTLEAIFE